MQMTFLIAAMVFQHSRASWSLTSMSLSTLVLSRMLSQLSALLLTAPLLSLLILSRHYDVQRWSSYDLYICRLASYECVPQLLSTHLFVLSSSLYLVASLLPGLLYARFCISQTKSYLQLPIVSL